MEGLPKTSPVVEVQRKGVVPEGPEGLVVVSIHVTCEEIEHRHVHEIVQSPALIVGGDFPDQVAVVRFRFPLCFSALVVRSSPWVSPNLRRNSNVNVVFLKIEKNF